MREKEDSTDGKNDCRQRTEKGGEREGKKVESLFQALQAMDIKDRIRLAMCGGKEARTLLIRDPNRAVQLAVLENPKMSDGEVAVIASSRNVDDDVLRAIATRREWVKHYSVRLALVKNPKTPLPVSLNLIKTLMRRDLKIIAYSKSIPAALAQAAKRLSTAKD